MWNGTLEKTKIVLVFMVLILKKKVFTGVYAVDEFLVSKETVVLRRWERSKQKFGFIKRVDKG